MALIFMIDSAVLAQAPPADPALVPQPSAEVDPRPNVINLMMDDVVTKAHLSVIDLMLFYILASGKEEKACDRDIEAGKVVKCFYVALG